MATRECFVREKAVRVQGKVLAVYFDFCIVFGQVFSAVFSLKYLQIRVFVGRERKYCCEESDLLLCFFGSDGMVTRECFVREKTVRA